MPKATSKQTKKLARLSSDCSRLLTHLIRKEDTIGKDDEDEFRKLCTILDIGSLSPTPTPTLKGNPIGWFSVGDTKLYKPGTKNQFILPSSKDGVCFTDSTLHGLKAHGVVFNSKYGIAFERDFLFQNGANPCLNINEFLLKAEVASDSQYNHVYNFIPQEISGFINIINKSFDATYEREWRIIGDFSFEYSNIQFIFCPKEKFSHFAKIQTNGLPVLFDLDWLNWM